MASNLPHDVTKSFSNGETLITHEKMMSIKLKLMSRDQARMITAVSWIKQNLDSASDSERECLIEAMIENDVLTYFCKNIRDSYDHLFKSMLEVVPKLIPNRNFYLKNLAKVASESIIEASSIMAKRMDRNEEILSVVTFTLYQLLNGASRAQVPLEKVYNPDQMVLYLGRLDAKRSSSYGLRLSAAKSLCLIMPNLKFPIKEETRSWLFTAFKDTLLFMGQMILDFGDEGETQIIESYMEILCSACAIGTRFCKELEGDFATEITLSMIDIVIPRFKEIKFEREVFRRSVQNFINCLDEIFKLKNDNKELAKELVSHGYLKYFLEILIPRKSVSSLLSQIIAKFSEDDFAQSDSPEELEKFQNNINKEILALPSDVGISTILEVKPIVSDAFLILLYYHSLKTHEYDLVPLSTMINKLISMVLIEEVQSDLVLKAVWFLFMVSSPKGSEAVYADLYPEALKKLAQLLRSHDLKKCYTHNRALLDCSLNCKGFPLELQTEVVRLWLDFNGDIETLLESKKIELIDDCLVKIVETNSGKLVKLALQVLSKLESDKQRWVKICERVWERLPKALDFCSVNSVVNVKVMLKLALRSNPGETSLEIYRESALTLAKLLTDGELDDDLKILLLQYVNKLLQIALERKSSIVVQSCVKHAILITILRDQGLARGNWPLSGCCMDLIVSILRSQENFKIQSSESDVVEIEPLKIVVLLARSNYEITSATVRLLTILLKRTGNFIMSVGLVDFENVEAADEAITAWYQQVHYLLPKKQMEDWHLIFRCLIAVLEYCYKVKMHITLKRLGDYACTYDLVRRTIDHEYTEHIFFTFVETWLAYASEFQSANWHLANMAKGFEHLRIGPSEFEEIIELVSNFREKVKKSGINI